MESVRGEGGEKRREKRKGEWRREGERGWEGRGGDKMRGQKVSGQGFWDLWGS